jgi:hypothetical protein
MDQRLTDVLARHRFAFHDQDRGVGLAFQKAAQRTAGGAAAHNDDIVIHLHRSKFSLKP